jgi:hypothetical protein
MDPQAQVPVKLDLTNLASILVVAPSATPAAQ